MAGSTTSPTGPVFQRRPQTYSELSDERPTALSLQTSKTLATGDDIPENKLLTPSGQRAEAARFTDDLELLRIERFVSHQEHELPAKTKNRSHNPEPEDAFNKPSTKESTAKQKNENAALYRFWVFLRKFPRFVRYLVYLIPGAVLLLIPVLLGACEQKPDERLLGGVGGVELMWFGIWLEIVWCALWLTRLLTSLLPHLLYGIAWIGASINAKQWKDIGRRLELPTAVFLWFLTMLISFKPLEDGHHAAAPSGGEDPGIAWVDVVNKVIIALFTLSALNFVEKIVIQWIATSFHQRTYSTRIGNNKADIRQLARLYDHAKLKLQNSDSFWNNSSSGAGCVQTQLQMLHENARHVLGKVGHVANKVGNDLIGRKVDTDMPYKVVSELLRSTPSAHTLARFIYRSLVSEDRETVSPEDLKTVFKTKEEVDAAFNIFDKDLNGDISIDEFEAVCNEIHLEKKAIAASLKDLDSVINKLDRVFLFIIVFIAVIVFVSILSGSTAQGLASAGTTLLGLAWVLQATAQEFLQSIIFVFIKHPFDVGDRVTIYGSTGAEMQGDEYYVTEVSLLYTEFKKMQGHIVQAPNSVLNNLFILNQRRSNGIADPIVLEMRFGTPAHLIEQLKARMMDFCLRNKRDYQPTVITEMLKVDKVRSCSMNMVVIHKGNFQNELLRLTRHNKYVTELMHQMTLLGIQGPYRTDPGGCQEFPMYWTGVQPPPSSTEQQQPPPPPPPPPQQQQPVGDNSPTQHTSAKTPRHSASVRSQRLPTSNEEAIVGFQGVYENRYEHAVAKRVASLRQKERGLKMESDAGSRRGSSSALAQTLSRQSQGRPRDSHHRLFGRSRTGASQSSAMEPPV